MISAMSGDKRASKRAKTEPRPLSKSEPTVAGPASEDELEHAYMQEIEAEEEQFEPEPEPMDEGTGGTASVDLTEESKAWRRPTPPKLIPTKDALSAMQVDMMQASKPAADGSAVIDVYGLTKDGASVLLHVHNFYHYFYVPAMPDVKADALGRALEANLRNAVQRDTNRRNHGSGDSGAKLVQSIETVKKRSIMNYIPGDPELTFFKITVHHPRLMRFARDAFKRGGLAVTGTSGPLVPLTVFEGSLDYVLRFMIETDLVGCSWLTVPPGRYKLKAGAGARSLLQIEADVHANDIISHRPEGKWLRTAPLRRLSFDIECAGRKGVFPEAEKDSVIQIANYVVNHGEEKPAAKVIFTLDTCAPIVGALVLSYKTEGEMLAAWAKFVRTSDPDILTGYNIVNFDLPYLLDRARHLNVGEFPYLGRLKGQATVMKKTQMSSSAFGTHESRSFSIHGRVVFDVLQLITREYKLRSYSLNSVSAEFLGEQKEDVHYSIISELQQGDEQTRRRLAVYCLKDAFLPIRLLDKLLFLTNYIEMARVTGIPLGWLVSRGHMIKVVSLLHRKSHVKHLVIPDLERRRQEAGGSDGPQFEGATVIEPKRGYYDEPIATLDFASLYPSIIMAHNLCYSTLVRPEHVSKFKPEQIEKTPTGNVFVKREVKQGILTTMLEELLGARKQAKKDLKAATDPFMKEVLNGRQLALKISANAVYGFTGASVGKLPCMEISASTTAYGRMMIENTKAEVEKQYKDADVIYGDTDSVMIRFGKNMSLAESMRLGEEAAEAISSIFPKPVKLEFEKCYFPYLLISKKRYAGLLWTNVEKYDKMDCKGIESVRRDNCRLVANVISSVLQLLLEKRQKDKAVELVKSVISDLLQNKMDISLLVVSKALTKTDYENKQAHVVLAEKLRKRDAGTAPSIGDRVPYVIITGSKNQPAYSRAEDPLHVLENNLPIDNKYYLENMLRKPLERIFEPILKSATSSLFAGEHTRTVKVVTPKTGGMMRFTKVRLSCLGCKAPITSGALCKYCLPKEAEIYLRNLGTVKGLEHNYSSLWTECQRCMGDVCHDVLCSNGDCPIFYRRRKVQKDLDDASARLSRFDLEW